MRLEFWCVGSGFGVWGSGMRVSMVEGVWCMVYGLWFMVHGEGVQEQGVGIRVGTCPAAICAGSLRAVWCPCNLISEAPISRPLSLAPLSAKEFKDCAFQGVL